MDEQLEQAIVRAVRGLGGEASLGDIRRWVHQYHGYCSHARLYYTLGRIERRGVLTSREAEPLPGDTVPRRLYRLKEEVGE